MHEKLLNSRALAISLEMTPETPLETQKSVRVCRRCIMDTTAEEIVFDEDGFCNFCSRYEQIIDNMGVQSHEEREAKLQAIVEKIKKAGAGKDYDCTIGLSGGVDSSYLAYKAKELGLRPLAVHVDAGWNSELAVKNIEVLVKNIGIDLYTYVVDWEEIRDLQLSFLKASVANQDIPQDHAFVAALFKVTASKGIRFVLGGNNMRTESILPLSWGYDAMDLRHIKSIQRRFGTVKLKKYPMVGFFNFYLFLPRVLRIETVHLLNYMDYVKKDAMTFLQEKLGWRYYGGKHYESVFTKFFQAYYLPHKFGYDKRKAHLSSLIISGQMTREEALQEMQNPLYSPEQIREDKIYISKKVGISLEEFDRLLNLPNRIYCDYPSNAWMFRLKSRLSRFLKGRRRGRVILTPP